MKIIKIPASAGWLKKTTGVEKAPDKIIKHLEDFWFSETGVLPVYSFDEVKAPTQKTIFEKIKAQREFIALGGDHSMTYACFKAFASNHNNPGIIVFDAHPDLMPTTDPVNHENYLRALIEHDVIPAKNVIIVGLRNSDPDEIKFLKENKIKHFPMLEIAQDGKESVCNAIMAAARKFDALYLSIDIDAVDAAFAPGVTYPEVAGLTSRELLYFLHRIKKLKNLKAMDIVELNPDKDINNITALLAAKIVVELC
ncbi:arginase family protein [Candidatus Woesearchaeota archaeon]|nr:arginase family protein [Candidatus Woesearchaeota archaeon]